MLNEEIRVDKDVCLMKETFNLDHIDYEHMSPVIIPRGYTKRFIEGKITYEGQLDKIKESFSNVQRASDVVLCEGTGHCAVGSIVGVNNAKVASMIGADMVLVANGGLGRRGLILFVLAHPIYLALISLTFNFISFKILDTQMLSGSAFDELELNRVLCQQYNVRIAGVVLNKVIPSKYEQTQKYMAKALKETWGVPLLGCVPDRPYLGCPALMDLEALFKTELITGKEHRFKHYSVQQINLVTTSLSRFLENLRNKPSRTLYISHVTREDLILGFMAEYQRRQASDDGPFEAALLVCGRKEKYELTPEVRDMINGLKGAPVSKYRSGFKMCNFILYSAYLFMASTDTHPPTISSSSAC